MTVVGRIVALWRYPVKSMAAENLATAEVSWHGVAGDRRWAFVRDGQVRSGFPWLTMRELPELAHYRPRFADPGRPDASVTLVQRPSGGELEVADLALAAELGPGVRSAKSNAFRMSSIRSTQIPGRPYASASFTKSGMPERSTSERTPP